MTGLHNNPTIHRHKPMTCWLWLMIAFLGLALAGDTPPLTLPKGFLEDLPVIETFEDQEFTVFLAFVKEQVLPESTAHPLPPNPVKEHGDGQ